MFFLFLQKKINKIIEEIKNSFSGRKILICREMSKFYEEYTRTNVEDLKPYLKIPKGELTVIISEPKIKKNVSQKLNESDKKNIKKMIKTLSIKDIINLISKDKEISKKEIYKFCLSLKK